MWPTPGWQARQLAGPRPVDPLMTATTAAWQWRRAELGDPAVALGDADVLGGSGRW